MPVLRRRVRPRFPEHTYTSARKPLLTRAVAGLARLAPRRRPHGPRPDKSEAHKLATPDHFSSLTHSSPSRSSASSAQDRPAHARQRSDTVVSRLRADLDSFSRLVVPGRAARARSMLQERENDLLRLRLGELEMTELENSSLRLQVQDLERALESVQDENERVRGEVLEMAHLENASLRTRVQCLEREVWRRDAREQQAVEHIDDARVIYDDNCVDIL